MYQSDGRTGHRPAARVVLVLDIPSGPEELHTRAARLASEFGQLVTQSMPGVTARNAVMPAGAEPQRPPTRPTRAAGLHVDPVGRRVHVDGRPIDLTYREFELVAYLSGHQGRIVSRAELMRTVWADRREQPESSRTVDTHVRRVRAKLGAYSDALTTVRGHGYRFDPRPPTLRTADPARAACL